MDASGRHEALRRHFRDTLSADPVGAYRDWFRTQEELRERGDADTARVLADDLWGMLPGLVVEPPETRARFLHNAAVFYGSPGPAADLERARSCFAAALDHFRADPDTGWHARALHNFATALSNLGASAEELREAVAIRTRHNLVEGRASSQRQLEATLRVLTELAAARAGAEAR